jgi:hypothetical protein
MEAIAKSDIFFVIASVGTVLFIVVVAVIGAYAVKIARDVKHISGRVREEADAVSDDIASLRERIRDEGSGMRRILSLLFAGTSAYRRSKRRRRSDDDED